MTYTFDSPRLCGEVRAISSKSEAHRLLICAAFADCKTDIVCTDFNRDILATADCLSAIGAEIKRTDFGFSVAPVSKIPKQASFDCGESGSTLRFLLPVVAALGIECDVFMHGRLPQRPLSPLYEILEQNGSTLSPQGSNPLQINGKFKSGNYSIAANISSQFISGLLFALPLTKGDSTLELQGKIESAPYIDLTLSALEKFGAKPYFDGRKYLIDGTKKLISPKRITVGGDWSNAAFFLAAGAIGKNSVTVSGLDLCSVQGDREILSFLEKFGAEVTLAGDEVTVKRKDLCGIEIDAADIPDLVPILSVVASVSRGRTVIYNAARLRLKESDRLMSVCEMINNLGGEAQITDDGLLINGKSQLIGGNVDSYNDHRIAMSAAIASTVCANSVTVCDFEAVQKSYPGFAKDFEALITKKA